MQKIGRYEIVEELGRGSMGAVFKALDPQIGRTVAVKIILTANLPKEENDLYRSRFYREAQAAGKMSHPGIVTIHDIAEDSNGQPYLVMEYVEGQTLHKMLNPDPKGKITQRFPLEKSLDLCAQVAEALEYAHGRQVVHRDIKPSNIMVTPEGRAKIADFGIARLSGTEATHTASITGTPAYMSPEQFRGGNLDHRSDIFSLGSMLYWVTTGEKPFPGDSVTQVSFNVVYREPAPPRHVAPDLPHDLEVVLSRCLAKRPENRYASAAEVAADLLAIREGKPIKAIIAPMEETVEDTVATLQDVTPLDRAATPLSTMRGLPTPVPVRKSNLTGLLIILVVGLLAAAAWYGQQMIAPAAEVSDASRQAAANPTSATAPSDPAATPSSARPAEPVDTAPKPNAPAAGADVGPAKKLAPGTAARLNIDFRHNLKEGTILIRADGQEIFQGPLDSSGILLKTLEVPPGKHKISANVISEKDRFLRDQGAEAEFTADEAQTLEIRVSRSRLGLGGRNMTLKWKK